MPGELMRLTKLMSERGLASRREADDWIARGWVKADGAVAGTGCKVTAGAVIEIAPEARKAQEDFATILINKPVGYVSGQAEDGYEPARVLVTPRNRWREDRSGRRFSPAHLRSLVPAGRLDIDSVGLLVLTQDGRVARRIIGEASDVDKEYIVRVGSLAGGPPAHDPAALALLNRGLSLDGRALLPAQVEWMNESELRFVLREGRKRQIRRMCELVGLKVLRLKRVRVGGVRLGALPLGQWRYLMPGERF
ncbi:MAG: pseudouridine synthase [Duodenibacillus sp.]|nr:pseudouridine synthase [Duodenibacillus sp.]